ncbi:MAG TPA: hypothetical protein VK659_00180 [Asanoa sp.]|nr:hypothetical protein [Asanoa sp.]
MRHLGSLVLSLVLAPAIWVLSGYGTSEVGRGVGDVDLRLLGGFAALAAAGVLLTLLVLTRLSPVGPGFAGLVFIALSVWAALDQGLFTDLLGVSFFERSAGLVNPILAIGPVVGTLLLLTVTSPRRWRRYPPPVPQPAVYPGATVGPPAYQPAHSAYPTSPGFGAAPGSPAVPFAPPGLYGQGYGSPVAPTSGTPAQPPTTHPGPPPPMAQTGPPPPSAAFAPPPGMGHSSPPVPGPRTSGPVRTPSGPGTPPPPPPQFTPHVPRQPDPTEAADATTRLTPAPPPAPTPPPPPPPAPAPAPTDETTRLPSPPKPAPTGDETTRLTTGDEETTLLRPQETGDEETTVLRDRPEDEGGVTRPLRGEPPPPAAYPPPGHATPTTPPTDPDATRRL